MLEHFNMNYGERLIIWDFLFGTMVKDFNCYPPTGVNGIERWVVESDSTMRALITYWFKQTFYPFCKIGQSIGQEVARVIGSEALAVVHVKVFEHDGVVAAMELGRKKRGRFAPHLRLRTRRLGSSCLRQRLPLRLALPLPRLAFEAGRRPRFQCTH